MATANLDHAALVADLVEAVDVTDRWSRMTKHLAAIGMDQINYGILDTVAAARIDAPVRFLSTMASGWIDYYGDRRLDLSDPHVLFVRNGNRLPYRWGESVLRQLDESSARETVGLTVEAGLRSQLSVPMLDSFGGTMPVAGMTLGSSLAEGEYFRAIDGRESELVMIAQLFHLYSIGEVRREFYGIAKLSSRERDCLSYLAQGLRIDAIADRLCLARVTIELHLRRARKKLHAATLPEAVARALLFQEITIG
ncbi:LuxR family transcriptional regulator [Sphingomonas sp. 28-62-11]|uniref:helix-turn-helix transcriptional regulator n=1 Tax=Sphingomonas sp. 28-62-11 TaxID=1970432 RepID=UPI000BCA2B08|nr:MAG: hypothetical protein B7Y49_13335 [Sphingomonas sp. 28-62-11]